jgi:hypothetical protein
MEKTSTAFFLSLLKTLTHKVLKKRKGVWRTSWIQWSFGSHVHINWIDNAYDMYLYICMHAWQMVYLKTNAYEMLVLKQCYNL